MVNKFEQSRKMGECLVLESTWRKNEKELSFNIGSTFLPGRFKGYMLKLIPLDGVYYLDIRDSMINDEYLSTVIQPFDSFIFDDLPKFV